MAKKKSPLKPVTRKGNFIGNGEPLDRAKIKSRGSRGQINADMEVLDPYRFDRKAQREKIASGEMTREDVFVAMHFRQCTVQEISRRLNVKPHTVKQMLGVIYEETDKELIESPSRMRLELGGTMLRWFRKIDDRIMSETAEPFEWKAGVMLAEKLAKLTGANAPEEVEFRSLNINANVEAKVAPREKTAIDVLKDRDALDVQMQEELAKLTEGRDADEKIIAARVLPGSLSDARPRALHGPASHSMDADAADEAGGEDNY